MTIATTPRQPISSGFGKRSSATNVLEGIDLHGKTVLLTGGYSGIGLPTAGALIYANPRGLHDQASMRKDQATTSADSRRILLI